MSEQLKAFKRNFAKVDLRYARRKNLTPYDVLIIASLIDREAAVREGARAVIASVIYNRLQDDISLGIDATVRFITGNWTEPLKQSELANPSPYNTRVHPGLPPGPIGNPGLASIRRPREPGADGLPLLRRGGVRQRHATSSPRRTPSSSATSTSTTARARSAAASRPRTVERRSPASSAFPWRTAARRR